MLQTLSTAVTSGTFPVFPPPTSRTTCYGTVWGRRWQTETAVRRRWRRTPELSSCSLDSSGPDTTWESAASTWELTGNVVNWNNNRYIKYMYTCMYVCMYIQIHRCVHTCICIQANRSQQKLEFKKKIKGLVQCVKLQLP